MLISIIILVANSIGYQSCQPFNASDHWFFPCHNYIYLITYHLKHSLHFESSSSLSFSLSLEGNYEVKISQRVSEQVQENVPEQVHILWGMLWKGLVVFSSWRVFQYSKWCSKGPLGCVCGREAQEICDQDWFAPSSTLQGLVGSSSGRVRFHCRLKTLHSLRWTPLSQCCSMC